MGSLDKSLASSSATSLWEPADQVQHIIRLGGQLFFHCGNIIYTKVLNRLVQILFWILPCLCFSTHHTGKGRLFIGPVEQHYADSNCFLRPWQRAATHRRLFTPTASALGNF
jgi:hypothetical protein